MRSFGRTLGFAFAVASSLSSVACAARQPAAAAYGADEARAFVEARAMLDRLRAPALVGRTEKVGITLDAPYLPSQVSARGAIAARPPDGLRMILLGPGGTTAMDLWVGGERFRFAIPALERVLRGDENTPPEKKRGLPVDFLRWWMLNPLGGELIAARHGANGALEILLREDARITEATLASDGSVTAHRTTMLARPDGTFRVLEEEWLEATSLGCAKAVYRQKTTSLTVTATCESTRPSLNEEALKEPEDPAP
ncbi:MAG: hypothetical protein U0271_10810 [Polyangiaceae bacterium]